MGKESQRDSLQEAGQGLGKLFAWIARSTLRATIVFTSCVFMLTLIFSLSATHSTSSVSPAAPQPTAVTKPTKAAVQPQKGTPPDEEYTVEELLADRQSAEELLPEPAEDTRGSTSTVDSVDSVTDNLSFFQFPKKKHKSTKDASKLYTPISKPADAKQLDLAPLQLPAQEAKPAAAAAASKHKGGKKMAVPAKAAELAAEPAEELAEEGDGTMQEVTEEPDDPSKPFDTAVRPKSLAEHNRRRLAYPTCGSMPASMRANFTAQVGTQKKTAVTLPAKNGHVGVSTHTNTGTPIRTRTENGPRKQKVESTKSPNVKPREKALVDCLVNLAKCGKEAWAAAHALKPVQQAALHKAVGIGTAKRFKTCAIVGNSGAMLQQPYGRYIDQHDVVVRINVLENTKYTANLGQAAHFRVLSYKMSKDVCCIMPKGKHPPDNPHLTYLLWFPASRPEIMSAMKKRYPNPTKLMGNDFLSNLVAVFKGMRSELVRMGFGPFEDWEFITSGMHAVLAFLRSCDSLNVFGFTTDINNKSPYWFTGRNTAPRSGRTQHAWDHERMILRLLHAAGLLNICTT